MIVLRRGTRYAVVQWNDERPYWRPEFGEILWRSTGYSKKGYEDWSKENRNSAGIGGRETYRHILILQNGEWVDFWGQNGRIMVTHSSQKFGTREEAWAYIDEHWREGSFVSGGPAKRVLEINLFDALAREFFRPKSLEFDARPFTYDPLISVKKVGLNWELLIKGADEPNRAAAILDKDFKLIKATRKTAAG